MGDWGRVPGGGGGGGGTGGADRSGGVGRRGRLPGLGRVRNIHYRYVSTSQMPVLFGAVHAQWVCNLSVVLDDHSPLGELRCVRCGDNSPILGPLGRDPAGGGPIAVRASVKRKARSRTSASRPGRLGSYRSNPNRDRNLPAGCRSVSSRGRNADWAGSPACRIA